MMRKFFKYVWKSLQALAAVVVIAACVIQTHVWWKKYNDYYSDDYISNNVSRRYYYMQNEYKLYNHQKGKIMVGGIDWIVNAAENDSLTVFSKEERRGYVNVNTGKVEIPAQYLRAWVFSDGLAAVMNHSGKIGFINEDNEVMIPFKFDYRANYPIDYLFHNGYCVMTDERGACGIIDKNGNWVMEPKYDCIWRLYFGKYRIVKDGEKYGLINENLNFVFPIEYDNIELSTLEQDGLMLTKDNVKQHMSFDGTLLEPFVIDGYKNLYYTKQIDPIVMHDGDNKAYALTETSILSDYLQFQVGYNKGVMHRETGKVIVPAKYEYIDMVSPTLFKASLWDSDESILLNTNGSRVK